MTRCVLGLVSTWGDKKNYASGSCFHGNQADVIIMLEMFNCFAHPHLEYAAPVCGLHHIGDFTKVEKKFKIAFQIFTQMLGQNYQDLSITSGNQSLENYRIFLKPFQNLEDEIVFSFRCICTKIRKQGQRT